jgi:hypothetical protein
MKAVALEQIWVECLQKTAGFGDGPDQAERTFSHAQMDDRKHRYQLILQAGLEHQQDHDVTAPRHTVGQSQSLPFGSA